MRRAPQFIIFQLTFPRLFGVLFLVFVFSLPFYWYFSVFFKEFLVYVAFFFLVLFVNFHAFLLASFPIHLLCGEGEKLVELVLERREINDAQNERQTERPRASMQPTDRATEWQLLRCCRPTLAAAPTSTSTMTATATVSLACARWQLRFMFMACWAPSGFDPVPVPVPIPYRALPPSAGLTFTLCGAPHPQLTPSCVLSQLANC